MSQSSKRIDSFGDEDDVHNSNAPRLRVVTALITWQGAATVAGIVASTGWGIVLLMLLYLPHLAISTVAAAAKKPIRLVNIWARRVSDDRFYCVLSR